MKTRAAIRATQGKGVMPDGTSRFSIGKTKIHHYMGCSTFAQHTVLPEIALAKARKDEAFDLMHAGESIRTVVHLHE